MKERALALATNLRGWKTPRKMLIVESDDWGAIRMPSPEAWKRLHAAGVPVDQSAYDRVDCLESRKDLDALCNVIDAQRDRNNQPAVLTVNTVMGNPDFEAIENDGFQEFHHEHFFDTYRRCHGENLEAQWDQAIRGGFIKPQFHGREHLNVPLWMKDLREGKRATRIAFDERFYGLTTTTSSARQRNYLAAFSAESDEELQSANRRLTEGLRLFKQTFGFSSETVIACNYVLPRQAEAGLVGRGVRLLQGQRGQFVPSCRDASGSIRRSYTGQRSSSGLTYAVRNVSFEPFESLNRDWVDSAMAEINQAFLLRTPAILCSHRANYTSGMSVANRDRGLRLLSQLLERVRKRWPEVDFLSSVDLANAMVVD